MSRFADSSCRERAVCASSSDASRARSAPSVWIWSASSRLATIGLEAALHCCVECIHRLCQAAGCSFDRGLIGHCSAFAPGLWNTAQTIRKRCALASNYNKNLTCNATLPSTPHDAVIPVFSRALCMAAKQAVAHIDSRLARAIPPPSNRFPYERRTLAGRRSIATPQPRPARPHGQRHPRARHGRG